MKPIYSKRFILMRTLVCIIFIAFGASTAKAQTEQTETLIVDMAMGTVGTSTGISPMGDTYKIHMATGTLTLTDFTWETSAATALEVVGGDVIIELAPGTRNSIKTNNSVDISRGIDMKGNALTLTGDGSLFVEGGSAVDAVSYGIEAGNITISSSIEVMGGTSALHVPDGGSILLPRPFFVYQTEKDGAKAISDNAPSTLLSEKYLKLQLPENERLCFDAQAGVFFFNRDVDERSYDPDYDELYNDQGNNWSFANDTLTLSGFTWASTNAIGFMIVNGDLIINLAPNTVNTFVSVHPQSPSAVLTDKALIFEGSGTLSAKTGNSTNHANGIVAANLTINSGTIIAESYNDGSGDAYGLYVRKTLAISGGTVKATAGNGFRTCGISADEDVLISGGTIEATAGSATTNSFGISGSAIAISGGTVKAKAGDAMLFNSYGIFARGSDITISGGEVEAIAGEAARGISGALSATGNLVLSESYIYTTIPGEAEVEGEINPDPTFAGAMYVKIISRYKVSITNPSGVTADKAFAFPGDLVTLTIAPPAGQEFVSAKVVETATPNNIVGNFTVSPGSFTMPACGVTITATFRNTTPATYPGIRLSQTNDALTVRILSNGTEATGAITLTLSGADAHAFTLAESRLPGISAGNYVDVTLTPVQGLKAGTYTVKLTAKGNGSAMDSITLTYTVESPATYPGIRLSQTNDALTVRILSNGTEATGAITLTLSGDDAHAFTLAESRLPGISVGNYVDVTLTPVQGLKAGTYTVKLTAKGNGSAMDSITLTYTVESPVPNEHIEGVAKLNAHVQDGILIVKGLTVGKPWQVCTLMGQFIKDAIADSNEAQMSLPQRGAYIVISERGTVKVIW